MWHPYLGREVVRWGLIHQPYPWLVGILKKSYGTIIFIDWRVYMNADKYFFLKRG